MYINTLFIKSNPQCLYKNNVSVHFKQYMYMVKLTCLLRSLNLWYSEETFLLLLCLFLIYHGTTIYQPFHFLSLFIFVFGCSLQ